MKLVTLHTFDNTIQAHLMRCFFESEGLQCFVHDEHTVDIYQLYSSAIGGVKLKIWEEDLQVGKLLLASWNAAKLTNEQGEVISCVNCNSEEINYEYKSMTGLRGLLSVLWMFCFLLYPLYFKRMKKCKDCGHVHD